MEASWLAGFQCVGILWGEEGAILVHWGGTIPFVAVGEGSQGQCRRRGTERRLQNQVCGDGGGSGAGCGSDAGSMSLSSVLRIGDGWWDGSSNSRLQVSEAVSSGFCDIASSVLARDISSCRGGAGIGVGMAGQFFAVLMAMEVRYVTFSSKDHSGPTISILWHSKR